MSATGSGIIGSPLPAGRAGICLGESRLESAPALEVEDVRVSYGDFVAVERASFSVLPGECVAVVGPNGNGKSTLAMAVCGLLARRGTVRLFGQVAPASDARWAVKHGLVLVPERRQLFPRLSVIDNILLGCYGWTQNLRRARSSEAVARALELFPELVDRHHQLAGTLSGGQQQMVALARGLSADPRVLVTDEPCLGLSHGVSERLYTTIHQLNESGMTVVLIEENPARALRISHRVVRVERGVASQAPPADFVERPAEGRS